MTVSAARKRCTIHFMLVATKTDDAGGRFAVLRTEPDRTTDTDSRSSKRRRRKSAKGDLQSTGNGEEPSQHEAHVLTPGSSSSSATFAKPPLRAISEAPVLRSNSAEPGTALDAVSSETSLRLDRPSVPDALQHPRRPHMSLSFQESRPATQGLVNIITAATNCITLEAGVFHIK